MMDWSLRDKVAIVTGASQGIGRAIALAFAEAGALVAVSSRKLENVAAVAREIEDAGGQAIALQAHTGSTEQVSEMVAATVAKWGRIDILVNNAGTNPHYGPVLTADDGQIDKILDVNLKGYFRTARAAVPHMRANGGGCIINISSITGLRPPANMGIYGISKAAVIQLTQVLARDLGPDGIRVNAIAPGIIKTRFSRALWEDAELMAMHERFVPLRVVGEPEDVAAAAVYLASAGARWVTGATIVVDGGASLASVL